MLAVYKMFRSVLYHDPITFTSIFGGCVDHDARPMTHKRDV